MAETQTSQVQVNQWKRPLFSNCFNNKELCIITYVAPCVTFGYNVQRVHNLQDKDCLIYGCLYTIPFLDCFLGTTTRRDIREERAIDGTVVNDCLIHSFCPCCALMQENEELDIIEQNRPSQEPAPGAYVVTSQPGPPPDSLPPATEETPYDPTEDQDLGDPQTENKY